MWQSAYFVSTFWRSYFTLSCNRWRSFLYLVQTKNETLSSKNETSLFRSRFSLLKPGDIIAVKCSWLWDAFHLGIYLGKDHVGRHQVIDYTNDSKVNRIDLDDFLTISGSSSSYSSSSTSRSPNRKRKNLGSLYRVRYRGISPKYNPEAITIRALQMFKTNDFGEYRTVFNNCEHFVTYCTFGKRFSYQIAKKVTSWWPFNYTIEIVV